jgi:hypothetical protein
MNPGFGSARALVVACTLMLGAAAPATLRAQAERDSLPSLAPDTRMRVRLRADQFVYGLVTSTTPESLYVRTCATCTVRALPWSDVTAVDVSEGHAFSAEAFARSAAIGAAVGAVVGTVLFRILAARGSSDANVGGIDTLFGQIGASIGLVIGGLVGLGQGTEAWTTVWTRKE